MTGPLKRPSIKQAVKVTALQRQNPPLRIGTEMLEFVPSLKYLGHIITCNNNDDSQREINNMFVRTNILIRKFSECTDAVKIVLFKAYCIIYMMLPYGNVITSVRSIRRGLIAITDALNCFFWFKRRDSLTSILVNLGFPSFDTVLANATFSFVHLWSSCNNDIVTHLQRGSIFRCVFIAVVS